MFIRLARQNEAYPISVMSREYIEHDLEWKWTPPRIKQSILSPTTNVAVAQEEAHIVGFGIMKYSDHLAHLELLGIHGWHRRKGIGTTLVHWLEKSAQVYGIEPVQVEARLDNCIAVSFYKSLGYAIEELLPGHYCNRIDGVRLSKKLQTHPVGL